MRIFVVKYYLQKNQSNELDESAIYAVPIITVFHKRTADFTDYSPNFLFENLVLDFALHI